MITLTNTFKKVFLFLFLLCPLYGCDEEVERILDRNDPNLDIPITFIFQTSIAVPKDADPNASNTFVDFASYDLLTNPSISNQVGTAEMIKNITITQVQYEYRNFSGNVDAIVNGSVEFFTQNVTTPRWFTTPANLAEASATTELFTLTEAAGTQIDPGNGVIGLTYAGNTSANPAVFDFRVTVTATISVRLF